MTKRKAIEEADLLGFQDFVAKRSTEYHKRAMEYAWEFGRIAGLREAANLRSVNGRSAGGPISVSRDAIKDHASELAKKARTK